MSGRVPPFELEVDGESYEVELAECERFSLGLEDHGIFTAFVIFSGPGWGQGLPSICLDGAYGMAFIKECVRVLGSPERAKGAQVAVFRNDGMSNGEIRGFARLMPDGQIGEPFIVDSLKGLLS